MITIRKVKPEENPLLLDLIKDLLIELGDEASDLDKMDDNYVTSQMAEDQQKHISYFALDENNIVGFFTVAEMFAAYSGGYIGVINEMYSIPSHRSKGIGKLFIDKIKQIAIEKNWKRIDVTAPTEERWERTVKFYEQNGFAFTGPKLKFDL